MENKINIAELLKDCPQGMELDCLMFENVYFDKVSDDKKAYYPILCYITDEKGNRNSISFTKNGCESMRYGAKCVIFPKGKTTWEGFVPPCQFKDGDVVTNIQGAVIIYKKITTSGYCGSFVSLDHYNKFIPHYESYLTDTIRPATEEEKEKLFDAIKEHGYKWNEETKTLEKLIGPNFHEGDWIACEELNTTKILSINMDRYEVEFIDGNKGFPHIDYIDRNFHLWTIQDAKDGDILAFNDETIVIFKDLYNKTSFHSYCHIEEGIFTISKKDMPDWWEGKGFYPATEEQRTFLFRKIKEAGYKWNAETKTLEKLPKFKVGNRIKYINGKNKDGVEQGVILSLTNDTYDVAVTNDMGIFVPIAEQDNWELVPNKFDITTLKAFESKVLVRDINTHNWIGSFYSHYEPNGKKFYIIGGSYYLQCIPYEGNEHLLDTSNDCDEYYKTW